MADEANVWSPYALDAKYYAYLAEQYAEDARQYALEASYVQVGSGLGRYEDDLTLNDYSEFVTYGVAPALSQWKLKLGVDIGYTIDSTTYPNPEDDPNLVLFTGGSSLQTVTELSELGVIGDGTDETALMQDILANFEGGTLLGDPTGTYVFTELLHITTDHTVLDFQGADVKWQGTGNVNDPGSRANGVINVRGNNISSFTYPATIVTAATDAYTRTITVTGTVDASLVAGTWVSISTVNSSGDGKAHIDILTQLESVTDNGGTVTLAVRDNLAWAFSGDVTFTTVEPVFNSGVKNLTLYDESSSSDTNAVCGVNIMRCVDAKVSGVNMHHHWNPVLTVYSVNGIALEDGRGYDPVRVGGGQGYYVQFGSSRNILAKSLRLYNGRHVVDFTSCGYGKVEDCIGVGSAETDFSMHGEYEHDITIKNSVGSVGIAISGLQFGETARNVHIEKVAGASLFNYAKGFNVTVKDSSFGICSTNTFNLTTENTDITEYLRQASTPVHANYPDIKSNAVHKGGKIKFETYNGANAIPEGVRCEFHGTHVVAKRDPTAHVNMHSFTMHGGIFEFGFNTPWFSGTWNFKGTQMLDTTFELGGHCVDGGTLILDGVTLAEPVITGLIRNKIPATGIQEQGTGLPTLDGRFTVIVKDATLEVPDDTYKTLDFEAPNRCLNLDISGLNLRGGVFTCDTRFPTTSQGLVSIHFSSLDTEAATNLSYTNWADYKHANTLIDLNTELGYNAALGKNQAPITVFKLDHTTASSGFLAYNYPLDDQAKGLLTIIRSNDSNYVTQRVHYMYAGQAYDNAEYVRGVRFGSPGTWKLI